MFTNVLVPLDGTPQSNIALLPARTIAHATHAAITLVHVVPVSDLQSGADAELERIAAELRTDGTSVSVVMPRGEPAEEILRQIETRGVDLIVMRTHGRSGIGRAVLGSVAEQVLSHSAVPVLMVRPGGRRLSNLRTLLVPVDSSPGGAVALGAAIGLARATDASLKLIEVVQPIPNYAYGELGWGGALYIDPAWDDEALASARAYVAGVTTRLRETGLTVHGEVQFAPYVWNSIVSYAEEIHADLIVMSTQALTGPARALLGSVADDVVRHADCPVLLLHRPAQLIGSVEHTTEFAAAPA